VVLSAGSSLLALVSAVQENATCNLATRVQEKATAPSKLGDGVSKNAACTFDADFRGHRNPTKPSKDDRTNVTFSLYLASSAGQIERPHFRQLDDQVILRLLLVHLHMHRAAPSGCSHPQFAAGSAVLQQDTWRCTVEMRRGAQFG